MTDNFNTIIDRLKEMTSEERMDIAVQCLQLNNQDRINELDAMSPEPKPEPTLEEQLVKWENKLSMAQWMAQSAIDKLKAEILAKRHEQ